MPCAAGAVPSAWAVGSSKPPRGTSGTVNFHWWTGGRNDYQRAISEVEPLMQTYEVVLDSHFTSQLVKVIE